ncbi:GntR family transcriptional regulator [Actinacidiphila epipremni]|jgi:DNA-binding GntR family transcriptional regulator|uniref:GntR family transcriptional regulator n=1 Tax=Actinacidiphila epipremni TaxID=2053013 RepID=A0ABX0ZXL9_9ACTN|nr:GntR family transcriptional regulator [Actinacidiphila epipremni]NJP46333.1 GntR family transcriptional regulator [Actinacidiphila epipremni]
MVVPFGSARPGVLPPSRTEAVLETIKHAILIGELKPGQALVEAELAERLGISKTPVREALKTLAGSGLVEMLPYRGVTVRRVDTALARAVYDMRLLLEPVAAARATASGRVTDEAASALDLADGAEDAADRSLANRAFHRALYAGCGNPLMVKALDDLRDQTALVSSAAWSRQPSWEQEAREHREILAAARAGDSDLVRALMRGHISAFVARNFPESEVE